ncbi:hypothetical protein [Bradyrhizobium sp. RT5a]|uniref:hypothetical protein n=1 Tax=unclassified Bradyrhizobium TaxID=2631580 RepID=UPI00339B251A
MFETFVISLSKLTASSPASRLLKSIARPSRKRMIPYHYTSAAGLHGIVASRSLWTSHYRFLNDTSEFLHGWKIVLDAIDRRGAKIRDISSLAWETVT